MRCPFCHTENTPDRTSCIACGTLLLPQPASDAESATIETPAKAAGEAIIPPQAVTPQSVPIQTDQTTEEKEIPMNVVVEQSKPIEPEPTPMTPQPVTISNMPPESPDAPELPEEEEEQGSPWLAIGIIAGVVILLALGGYFVYVTWIKGPAATTPTPTETPQPLGTVLDVTNLRGEPFDGGVELTWDASSDPDLDNQVVKFEAADESAEEASVGTVATSFTVDQLENRKAYTFTVFVENSTGARSAGARVTVTPGTEAPQPEEPTDEEPTGGSADDDQRKQDLEDLQLALESYYADELAYPKSQNYTSLLNTLIRGKYVSRRIQDPTFPDDEYEYRFLSDGLSYELTICLDNSNDPILADNPDADNCVTVVPELSEAPE